MYPQWVLKHKKPGTTVKQIGKNYYLYFASSHREPEKKYPVSVQTYIGKITEQEDVRGRFMFSLPRFDWYVREQLEI